MRRLVPSLLALAMIASAEPGQARGPDPWLGRDKAAHFAVSLGIASITYGVSTRYVDARGHALLIGGGVSLTIGAGKELLDLAGYGDPSWKDLVWDVIGTAAGLAVGWTVDVAIRGVDDRSPALAAPERTIAPQVFRLSF